MKEKSKTDNLEEKLLLKCLRKMCEQESQK